jgi:hypothetical protein
MVTYIATLLGLAQINRISLSNIQFVYELKPEKVGC